jgi:hypothetical protein
MIFVNASTYCALNVLATGSTFVSPRTVEPKTAGGIASRMLTVRKSKARVAD